MVELHKTSCGIVLTEAELIELTHYRMPRKQLEALHHAGFERARIGGSGRVVLERAHYDAVCAGRIEKHRPRLRAVRSMMHHEA